MKNKLFQAICNSFNFRNTNKITKLIFFVYFQSQYFIYWSMNLNHHFIPFQGLLITICLAHTPKTQNHFCVNLWNKKGILEKSIALQADLRKQIPHRFCWRWASLWGAFPRHIEHAAGRFSHERVYTRIEGKEFGRATKRFGEAHTSRSARTAKWAIKLVQVQLWSMMAARPLLRRG